MTWITLTERDFFFSSQATLMAFFFEAVCAVRSLFSSDGELGENLSVLFTLCGGKKKNVEMFPPTYMFSAAVCWAEAVLISNSALSPLQSLTLALPPI